MAENASNEIRVHVGDSVELSDDVAAALENLAEALSAEAEQADEVSGFMFEMQGGDAFWMMGMGPKISGETGDKPKVSVSGKCALDIVVTLPSPKL
jgi:hypothetical protein